MADIKQLSQDIANNWPGDRKRAFDVSTFMLIAEMIADLIARIQENCNTDGEGVRLMAKRGKWRDRRIVKLSARRALGRRRRKDVDELTVATLKTVKKMSASEVDEYLKD